MSINRLTVSILAVALLLVLIPIHSAQAQDHYEYTVQIRSDGSAYWSIEQYSAVDAEVYTWQDFQQILSVILDSAQAGTGRNMEVDLNSIQINTSIFAESKTTEYSFVWRNFSIIDGNKIRFGDSFQVTDFLTQLFSNASLRVTYPENYVVESVYPTPDKRNDQTHTLTWTTMHDLVNDNTEIVLAGNPSINDATTQTGLLLLTAGGLVAAIFVFFTFRQKKRRNKQSPLGSLQTQVLQTEEDKILNLLKTQGGTMRQSEITRQLHFSKAKTSQLLSQLENEGELTRYKKGRDKIVTIAKKD